MFWLVEFWKKKASWMPGDDGPSRWKGQHEQSQRGQRHRLSVGNGSAAECGGTEKGGQPLPGRASFMQVLRQSFWKARGTRVQRAATAKWSHWQWAVWPRLV